MRLFEVIVTFILIAPLIFTLIILAIRLVGTGVRDLMSFVEERKESEGPPPEVAGEAEIDDYIEELKKNRKLRQSA